MTLLRELGSFYRRIARTYVSWSPNLLLLALVVFVPFGLIDALSTELNVDSLNIDSGIKVAALLAAVGALTTTSLLGEVFYSGAIALSLTGPADRKPLGLRETARRLDYKRLIAVDLVYVLIVVVGMLLFIVPGALAFVYLGLAGPVVEIEKRGVRESLGRSYRLVRGRFWLVFLVLAPIELVGDALGEALGHLAHNAFGETFFATWVGEALSNVVLSPIFAVACVLLTLDLIAEKDGSAPALNPHPTPTPVAA